MANDNWLEPWKLVAGIPAAALGGLKLWWARKDEANRLLRQDLAEARAALKASETDHDAAREALAKLRESGIPRRYENTILHARQQRVLKLLREYCRQHNECADPEFQEIRQAMLELGEDIVFGE